MIFGVSVEFVVSVSVVVIIPILWAYEFIKGFYKTRIVQGLGSNVHGIIVKNIVDFFLLISHYIHLIYSVWIVFLLDKWADLLFHSG